MSERKSIPVTNLLIDTQNPRLETDGSQADAIREMARAQGSKLTTLAEDIVENGLDPSSLPIVIPVDQDEESGESLGDGSEEGRYIVLEGNRRVTVLKALETPSLLSGDELSTMQTQFSELGDRFAEGPIEHVTCVVIDDQDHADHWIELRHTGENDGAGTVRWGAEETARYSQRRGKSQPHLQVLDFVRQHADLDENTREKLGDVALTNLERLLNTSYVRHKLGIKKDSGDMVTRLPMSEVLIGLKKVIGDLAHKRIDVNDIRYEKDRFAYIDSFDDENLPNLNEARDESEPTALLLDLAKQEREADAKNQNEKSSDEKGDTDSNKDEDGKSRKRGSRPSTSQRTTLIPKRIRSSASHDRVNDIANELRRLSVDNFPNAASVLFRVLVELSLDHYVENTNLPNASVGNSLASKMKLVCDDLEGQKLVNSQQAKSVRRMSDKGSLLGASVTTMHQYVHNRHLFPGPTDLKAAWDNLQPFIIQVWENS